MLRLSVEPNDVVTRSRIVVQRLRGRDDGGTTTTVAAGMEGAVRAWKPSPLVRFGWVGYFYFVGSK